MNDKIKELANQALHDSRFELIFPDISVGYDDNKVTIPLIFVDNLIKLVVNDCCSIMEHDHGVWASQEILKEHFGVE